ncbi:PREDICTED: transport [Prunus dulcis]|uniref:PREDICTED: transport n=1 Tax=Prunus dulcis TaxID=3755 RepID=A0A5E4FRR9_PRUDU|nr:PREDICTED: transport [Prunus dulcis]
MVLLNLFRRYYVNVSTDWSFEYRFFDSIPIGVKNPSRIFNLRYTPASQLVLFTESTQKMVLGGGAPAPRGSAAATASMRRRKTTSGGASGGAAGTMLQFYTDDAPGLKISPNVVLIMSIGFIAFVAVLHVMGKLYFVRREA